MSVLSMYTKIQTMVSQTTSAITAPSAMPTQLNTAHMPIALTFPAEADWELQAISYKRQNRTFKIRVYVKPVALGKGVDEGYQAVMPVLQAVGNKFLSSSGLSLENTVDHIDSIRDTGVGVLAFGETTYHGFEFSFTVVEKST